MKFYFLEQSLAGLDDTINEYEMKIENIDAETRDMVRSQVGFMPYFPPTNQFFLCLLDICIFIPRTSLTIISINFVRMCVIPTFQYLIILADFYFFFAHFKMISSFALKVYLPKQYIVCVAVYSNLRIWFFFIGFYILLNICTRNNINLLLLIKRHKFSCKLITL